MQPVLVPEVLTSAPAEAAPMERTLGAIGCSIKHRRWWRPKHHGHWVCEDCHAPVREDIVGERRTDVEWPTFIPVALVND